MPELLDESSNIESTTVGVFRTSATVKGGRRFSFNSLVVVGDRRGSVGYGYAKANEVPPAIEKAQKYARRRMLRVPLNGGTIPHEVQGRFGSARVTLVPASPGTGIVAGATVRAVLELAGVTDCLTKCFGSTNKINACKAAFDGLSRLQTRDRVSEVRGVEIESTTVDEMLERGKRFMPTVRSSVERAKGPVNTVGQDRKGGGRGGRGGRPPRSRRSGGDGDGGGPAEAGAGPAGDGAPSKS